MYVIIIFLPCFSNANITLENMYYDLSSSIEKYQIANSDKDSAIYVKVVIKEASFHGDKLVEKALDDETEILVSPQRLVIPPLAMVPFRVIRKPTDQFKLYRVYFTPVSAGDLNVAMGNSDDKTVKSGLNLRIGYGTIFFSNPDKQVFDTRVIQLSKESFVLENRGNSLVTLRRMSYCQQDGTCKDNAVEYLLPGQSKTLPRNSFVADVLEGKSRTVQLFEAQLKVGKI
ncbi:hypothetical protein ACPV3Y_25335 [Vibrio maritimus]